MRNKLEKDNNIQLIHFTMHNVFWEDRMEYFGLLPKYNPTIGIRDFYWSRRDVRSTSVHNLADVWLIGTDFNPCFGEFVTFTVID